MKMWERLGAGGALVTAAGLTLLWFSWWRSVYFLSAFPWEETVTMELLVGVLLLWSALAFVLLAIVVLCEAAPQRTRPWLATVGLAGVLCVLAVVVSEMTDGGSSPGRGAASGVSAVAIRYVEAGPPLGIPMIGIAALVVGLAPLVLLAGWKRGHRAVRPGHQA